MAWSQYSHTHQYVILPKATTALLFCRNCSSSQCSACGSSTAKARLRAVASTVCRQCWVLTATWCQAHWTCMLKSLTCTHTEFICDRLQHLHKDQMAFCVLAFCILANMCKDSCTLGCAVIIIQTFYVQRIRCCDHQGTLVHVFLACIIVFAPSANLSNTHTMLLEQHSTLFSVQFVLSDRSLLVKFALLPNYPVWATLGS